MIQYNYNKRNIRLLLKEIGINHVRNTCVVRRIRVVDPLNEFCIERNDKGDFLQHIPTGTLILSLANYKMPKEGWEEFGKE